MASKFFWPLLQSELSSNGSLVDANDLISLVEMAQEEFPLQRSRTYVSHSNTVFCFKRFCSRKEKNCMYMLPNLWRRKCSRCRLEPSPSSRCKVLCLASSCHTVRPSQKYSAEVCQGLTDQKLISSWILLQVCIQLSNLERETLQLVLFGVQWTALLWLLRNHSVWNLQTKFSHLQRILNPLNVGFLPVVDHQGGKEGAQGKL